MIIKQVKEYSNRQRIDINKSDGLNPGSEVVILSKSDYNNLINENKDLNNELTVKTTELQLLKDQENNLKDIVTDSIAPIDKHYQKELENKDNQIKQLKHQLNTLQAKANQHNLDMQGLNVFTMFFLRKHKKLISNFNDTITAITNDPKIIDADTKAIPGSKKNK